jgi:hypothetical protein
VEDPVDLVAVVDPGHEDPEEPEGILGGLGFEPGGAVDWLEDLVNLEGLVVVPEHLENTLVSLEAAVDPEDLEVRVVVPVAVLDLEGVRWDFGDGPVDAVDSFEDPENHVAVPVVVLESLPVVLGYLVVVPEG